MLKTSSIHVVLWGEHRKGWVVGCRDVGFDAGLLNTAEAMMPITWGGGVHNTLGNQRPVTRSQGDWAPITFLMFVFAEKRQGRGQNLFLESLRALRAQWL